MKIKHKLLLIFGILIILAFTIVSVNFMTYKNIQSDANFVNYSGKLRATNYRMAQLANLISNSNSQQDLKNLKENIELFDTILTDISQGNPEKGLSKLSHKVTIDELTVIVDKWNKTYKPAYKMILASDNKEALNLINTEVNEYVNSINEMVTNYSDYSSSKVMTAKIINIILSIVTLIIAFISFTVLNLGISKPINALLEELKELTEGNGDLRKRIVVKSKDEIGDMTNYFNTFIENIHKIVEEIAEIANVVYDNMQAISNTSEELVKSTELIAASSMDVADGAQLQNNKVDKLNDLVEKIKLDIQRVSDKSLQTLESSEKSQKSVKKGDNQVSVQAVELTKFVDFIVEASQTVEDLNNSSTEIKSIIDLIHNISSQTNLLALNASIEAARAGEAGRGFAVVADEIRKLAEETSLSAQRINGIVNSISEKSSNVKTSMDILVDNTRIQEKSMNLIKEELKEILDRTTITLNESAEIMKISAQVNDDFEEIMLSANDIQGIALQNSGNTQHVASAVEEQTASFEEVSANINSINEITAELTNIVGRFKI